MMSASNVTDFAKSLITIIVNARTSTLAPTLPLYLVKIFDGFPGLQSPTLLRGSFSQLRHLPA